MKKPYFSLRQRLQKVSWIRKFVKSPIFAGIMAVVIPASLVGLFRCGYLLNNSVLGMFPKNSAEGFGESIAMGGVVCVLLFIVLTAVVAVGAFLVMIGNALRLLVIDWLLQEPQPDQDFETPPPKRLTKKTSDNLPRFG